MSIDENINPYLHTLCVIVTYHEMVSYKFHHLCIFITIACLTLNNGDFPLSCKGKKVDITKEKVTTCC